MKKKLIINGKEVEALVFFENEGVKVQYNNVTHHYKLKENQNDSFVLSCDSQDLKVDVASLKNQTQVYVAGVESFFSSPKSLKGHGDHNQGPLSPMPGKVFKIFAKEGQAVKKGETLMIIEAMKMEHSIKSDQDAKIKKVLFKEGDMVQGGVSLIEFEK